VASNDAPEGYQRIMMGGKPHDFPKTMSDEEIAEALQREYAKPEPIKSLGAPVGVRAAVGAASNPIDRLKTLQRFYPDAEPFGDDNFVITDPGTNRRRLYNEENTKILGIPVPTAGDIAGAGPEIAEAIGAGMGAAAGVPGAPFGGPILGAGAGGALARRLYDYTAGKALGTTESQSDLAQMMGTTNAITANMAGQGFGGLLEKYGLPVFEASKRYVGGKLGDAGREVYAAANRLGIPLTASVATRNPTIEAIESGLSQMPFGRGPVVDRAEEMVAGLQSKASELASRFSGGKPVLSEAGEIGGFLREKAGEAGNRFLRQREQLDDDFTSLIGRDTAIPIDNLINLKRQWMAQIAKAPRTESANYGKAMEILDRVIQDSGKSGYVPLDVLRKLRTGLFADIHNPQATTAGWTDSATRNAGKILEAVRSDIYDAAKDFGPDALYKLRLHDRYTRFNNAVNLPMLAQIERKDLDERILGYVMEGTKEGAGRLADLKRNLKSDEWDTVAGSVFQRLGTPLNMNMEGVALGETVDQFSPARFITNWATLSDAAKKTLFAGTRYKQLEPYLNDIVKVAQGVKSSQKARNFSNTSGNTQTIAVILGLTGFGTGYSQDEGFDFGSSILPTAGAAISSRTMSKLLQSKAFLDWATRTASVVGSNPNAWPKQLSRVLSIAQLEPTLKPEVYDYYQAMLEQQKKESPGKKTEAP